MTEYILKTELPITTCRGCPCAEYTPFGTACPIKRGSEKRYGTCPLVELQPHGRLIDAVALKGSIEGRILAGQGANVFSEIDNATTVLEASE